MERQAKRTKTSATLGAIVTDLAVLTDSELQWYGQ